MHANNETGVVQPIADIARAAHRYGAIVHTEAAQSNRQGPSGCAGFRCGPLVYRWSQALRAERRRGFVRPPPAHRLPRFVLGAGTRARHPAGN
jgi:cysteine desulfurase